MSVAELKRQLTCIDCKDVYKNPRMISECRHVFCFECIQNHLKDDEGKCPKCQRPFTLKSLHRSERDARVLELYNEAIIKDRNEEYERRLGSIMNRYPKDLLQAIGFSDAETHFVYAALIKVPLPYGINAMDIKKKVVDKIAQAMKKPYSYTSEQRQSLFQLGLELLNNDGSEELVKHFYESFRYPIE